MPVGTVKQGSETIITQTFELFELLAHYKTKYVGGYGLRLISVRQIPIQERSKSLGTPAEHLREAVVEYPNTSHIECVQWNPLRTQAQKHGKIGVE